VILYFKEFTKKKKKKEIFYPNRHGNQIIELIQNSINDIITRIENTIPPTITVMLNEKDHERFNYAIYLDLIAGYSKIAILFEISNVNGNITDINVKDKFKKKTEELLQYIFRKYNISNDISSMISVKTTEVL